MSLTKKAFLGTVASFIEHAVIIISNIILSPILINHLGTKWFGIWKYCNQILGYIPAGDGKAIQTLKWTLALKNKNNQTEEMKTDIGAAIKIFIIFLPISLIAGGILAWYAPYLISGIQEANFSIVRKCCFILVFNMALIPIAGIPSAILTGLNKIYIDKISVTFSLIISLILSIIIVKNGGSIIHLALITCTISILTAALQFIILKIKIPWIGLNKANSKDVKKFLNLSVWSILWTIVNNILMSLDIFIIGTFISVSLVSSYTVSRYMAQSMSVIATIMVSSFIPGFGEILGKSDNEKAAKIKNEISIIVWLITVISANLVILYNKSFISIWVGKEMFVGHFENLMIACLYMQVVFIKTDSFLISALLKLKEKVLFGILSLIICAILSLFFMHLFNNQLQAILISLIIGRYVLNIAYSKILQKKIDISNKNIFNLRKIITTVILCSVLYYIHFTININKIIILIPCFILTSVLLLTALYIFGLNNEEKKIINVRLSYFLKNYFYNSKAK